MRIYFKKSGEIFHLSDRLTSTDLRTFHCSFSNVRSVF